MESALKRYNEITVDPAHKGSEQHDSKWETAAADLIT